MPVLSHKVAVITGGTRGFGLAVAKEYAKEGAMVVVASRSKDSVEQAIADLNEFNHRVSGRICDIASLDDMRALSEYAVQSFGKIDIWVNNAAISAPYGPTIEIPLERVLQVFNTNIIGTYFATITAMQYFLECGEGKLINILGAGDRRDHPMQNAYSSTKAWLIRFTKTLAQEYKDSRVGVYALNPGMMETELLTQLEVIEGYEDKLNSMETVLRVLSKPPNEPARKAVWLASTETDGRTGLILRETSVLSMLSGSMKELYRRITNRPGRAINIQITRVPSSLPTKQMPKK